jgi:hypothetical protein
VSERAWFIPGRAGPPDAPLARYRPIQPIGAVESYVQRFTQPGELVIDLFCQGPVIVREAAAAGRRALGFSINPLLLVAARLGLGWRDADAVNATFTHLADSLKGGVPLRCHLAALYCSACPACGAEGTAEWFAWDRGGNYPFRKGVQGEQAGDEQDDSGADDGLRLHARGKENVQV